MSAARFRRPALCALLAAGVGAASGCKEPARQESTPEAKPREASPASPREPVASPPLPTRHPFAFRSAIRSIFHDSQGRYWFGSHNEGAARLDDLGFTYFTSASGIPGDQVRSIHEDNNGTIWLTTADGSARVDGNSVTGFSAQTAKRMPPNLLRRPPDHADHLWFPASTRPGVLHYTGTAMDFFPFPASDPDLSPTLQAVTALANGHDERIWIATYAAVFSYDQKNGFKHLDPAGLQHRSEMHELHVRSILPDSRGNLWIGNNGLGVLRYDGHKMTDFSKDMGLVHHDSRRGGALSPQGTLEHVFAIEEDRAGNLWFGDRDTGVWKYDGRAMTNYGIAQGLPSLPVWDIHADRHGTVLVALDNGVVCRFVNDAFQPVFPLAKSEAGDSVPF